LDFICIAILNLFLYFSPEQELSVSVNEGASKVDQISNPSQDENSYCEHEQLTHMESIYTPHRYLKFNVFFVS
jgi:hypothetical protein